MSIMILQFFFPLRAYMVGDFYFDVFCPFMIKWIHSYMQHYLIIIVQVGMAYRFNVQVLHDRLQ